MNFKVITDKSIEEYMELYGEAYNEGELWDFSIEDVESGAINSEGVTYWLIDERLYETF